MCKMMRQDVYMCLYRMVVNQFEHWLGRIKRMAVFGAKQVR
jgi:hypothetical protein